MHRWGNSSHGRRELIGDEAPAAAHEVVPHNAWIEARTALLPREKEFTKLRDELSRARRALPWEEVTKEYVLAGPDGPRVARRPVRRSQPADRLPPHVPAGLGGRLHELLVLARQLQPMVVHLNAIDVSMVAVSISPIAKLDAYRRRMGWSFHWASAHGSDFSRDFGVSFTRRRPRTARSSTTACSRSA